MRFLHGEGLHAEDFRHRCILAIRRDELPLSLAIELEPMKRTFDTIVEDLAGRSKQRPWYLERGKRRSPSAPQNGRVRSVDRDHLLPKKWQRIRIEN
jgi:hypothetical protein